MTHIGNDKYLHLVTRRDYLDVISDKVSPDFAAEIEEMLRTCSRLIVMRDRHIVGELTGEDLNQAQVMKTIAGGEARE